MEIGHIYSHDYLLIVQNLRPDESGRSRRGRPGAAEPPSDLEQIPHLIVCKGGGALARKSDRHIHYYQYEIDLELMIHRAANQLGGDSIQRNV